MLPAISGATTGRFSNVAEQRLGLVRSELAYGQAQDILAAGLHEFLDALQTKLNAVGSAIFETYFALTTAKSPVPAEGRAGQSQRQTSR